MFNRIVGLQHITLRSFILPDSLPAISVQRVLLRLLCGAIILYDLEHGQSFPTVFSLLHLLYFVILQLGLISQH